MCERRESGIASFCMEFRIAIHHVEPDVRERDIEVPGLSYNGRPGGDFATTRGGVGQAAQEKIRVFLRFGLYRGNLLAEISFDTMTET